MLPHTSSAHSGIKKDEWEKELSEWRPSFSFLMKEGGALSADIIPSRLISPVRRHLHSVKVFVFLFKK